MQPYVSPAFNITAFNCPHCNAFAKQSWFRSSLFHMNANSGQGLVEGFYIAICTHCGKPSYWFKQKMIYPATVTAPFPNPDIPEQIKSDFEEARQIANSSPRGAAALLRLVIQKLCVHLGEPGKDLNKDIGSLVKKGLPDRIQKALDVVRVIGNESVHPGQIDLNDNPATTSKLFELVNIIADKMITEPKEIDKLFDGLPDGKREAIQKRDGQL
jgi:hypothetical protein